MQPVNLHFQYNRGLSLIELLVATVIVSVLLLGVSTVYLASKRSYRINDDIAEMQENARFAFHNITRDIRMAGYTGCVNVRNMSTVNTNVMSRVTKTPAGLTTGLTGNTFISGVKQNADVTGWTSIGLTKPTHWDNSQALNIFKASACSVGLIASVDRAARVDIDGKNPCNFKEGDLLMITDCKNADVFIASQITKNEDGSQANLIINGSDNDPPAQLSTAYDRENSHIYRLERFTYYVGVENNDPDPSKYEPPGLRQLRLTNNAGKYEPEDRLLVPYVKDLAITYGIDTDNDGRVDAFHPAESVGGVPLTNLDNPGDTPWSRILSVEIQYSVQRNPNDKEAPTPEKSFSTTINLRNNTI